MIRYHMKAVIFLIILLESALLVLGGFFALHFVYGGKIGRNVYVNGTDISGMSREEALEELSGSLTESLQNSIITISVDGEHKYKIDFNDIEAKPDYDAIIKKAYGENEFERLVHFIFGYLDRNERVVTPIYEYNKEKLLERIEELSILVDREPSDADIYIKNGKLVKDPEKDGYKLNINNSLAKFKKELENSPDFIIDFSTKNNFEIELVSPDITLEELIDIEDIISEYSTLIKSKENLESALAATYAINKALIVPASQVKNEAEALFSFNKYLEKSSVSNHKNDEGCNQVASTLYAAVLKAGINPEYITRSQHENYVNYIEPGLDVMVSEDGQDFEFLNTLENGIMILAEVRGYRIDVKILGKKQNKDERTEIESEIVQVYKPSVINLEDMSLKPGENRIITPGKDGLKVEVYKVNFKDDTQTSKEYLYTDIYKAEKSIVKVGPNTGWINTATK
ncbi:MAG: VanW family protein [Acetivibrionales bacterium]